MFKRPLRRAVLVCTPLLLSAVFLAPSAHAQRRCPPSRVAPGGLCCPPRQAWVPALNGCMAVGDGCPPGQHDSAGRCCNAGEEFVPAQNTCVCVQPGGCYANAPQQPQFQQPQFQQPQYQQPQYPQPAAPQGGLVQTQIAACYQGDADACVDAAVSLRDGTGGIARDDAQSAALLRRSCGQNFARGCTVLGYAFETGRGVRADPNQARVLYERGCEGGYASGCHNLGRAYYDGRGVARDRNRAVQLFQRACQGGSTEACSFLPTAQQQAQGDQQQQAAQGSESCRTLRIMQQMADLVGDGNASRSVGGRAQVACSMGGEVGDERWPNGVTMHFAASNNWVYPSGVTGRFGSSNNWVYPSGVTMFFGSSNNWVYPNGVTMLFGSSGTYTQPDGVSTSEQGLVTWACARMDPARCQRMAAQLNANQGFARNFTLLQLVWAAQQRR